MQYQRKSEKNEKKDRNRDNTESELEEMIYMEPIGNQVISPESLGQEQSIENNENRTNKDQQEQPMHTIIQTVKNDLKNKMDLTKLANEKPIHSIAVNLSSGKQEEHHPAGCSRCW